MEIDLEQFKQFIDYSVKKRVSFGCRSSVRAVRIKGEMIIMKKFPKNKRGIRRYFNEKNLYLKLKDEDFLPKLKYFDDKNRIIFMEDVGNSIKIFKKKKTITI